MLLANATAVKQNRNTEGVEELVNFVKNVDIRLSLGCDLDTANMNPFLFIFWCFVTNSI